MYIVKCDDGFYKFVNKEVFPIKTNKIEEATRFDKIETVSFIVDVMKDRRNNSNIRFEEE